MERERKFFPVFSKGSESKEFPKILERDPSLSIYGFKIPFEGMIGDDTTETVLYCICQLYCHNFLVNETSRLVIKSLAGTFKTVVSNHRSYHVLA